MLCYFCDKTAATSHKFGEPICELCNAMVIRVVPPREVTEKEKAFRLKNFMSALKQVPEKE